MRIIATFITVAATAAIAFVAAPVANAAPQVGERECERGGGEPRLWVCNGGEYDGEPITGP